MARVAIADVRSELQLPSDVISDTDVRYVISKLDEGADVYAVCAEVLRLFLRKNRGRTQFRIGKYSEEFDAAALRKEIALLRGRSANSVFDDGIEYPESMFKDIADDS